MNGHKRYELITKTESTNQNAKVAAFKVENLIMTNLYIINEYDSKIWPKMTLTILFTMIILSLIIMRIINFYNH